MNPNRTKYFDSFRKLVNAVRGTPQDDILYIGYKDDDKIGRIRSIAVWSPGANGGKGETVRPKEAALDELLGHSVQELLNNPALANQ